MSSHKSRPGETRAYASKTTTSNPSLAPVSRNFRRNDATNTAVATQRASVISVSSSGRQSSGSLDGYSGTIQPRPSGLPRAVSHSSQARLSYIASTRPVPTFPGKSPPLQALQFGLPTKRNPQVNPFKASMPVFTRQNSYAQTLSPMDIDSDTVLGIVVPEKASTFSSAALPPRLIPELQALAASNTGLANPASSSIGSISSPSTQFTTSSSPWSASTTTTTPVSWSSASPSIIQATQSVSNQRSHTVPIPANARTKLPKAFMPSTSDGSWSSSRMTLQSQTERSGRKGSKTPDLHPPPRSSSMKMLRSRSNSAATSKSEQQAPKTLDVPSLPVTLVSSTEPSLMDGVHDEYLAVKEKPGLTQGHSRLQEVLNVELRRSNSKAAPSSQESAELTVPSSQPRQLLEPLPVVQHQHRRFPSLSRRHMRQSSGSEPEIEKQSTRSKFAKFSKLAFFSRSKNNSTEAEKMPQTTGSRKGPAAGTGHEGYGRFGRRGRKQSTGSSTGATDSETSIASTSRKSVERRRSRISSSSRDQSELDDFTSSRMKPIVMVGGSQRGRADPFPPMPRKPQLSEMSLSTMSSAESYPAEICYTSPRRERFSPYFEEMRPSLATRRSLKFTEGDGLFRMPDPIRTEDLEATPCLDSRNTTQSSEPATPASAMYRLDPNMLEKQRSKSRRLKWNIFRRKNSISEADNFKLEKSRVRPGMSVDVASAPTLRPIPYYAMLESEPEINNTATIGQFLQEAAESPEREVEMIPIGFSDDEVRENPYMYRESVLLPSAPLRQAFPPLSTAAHVPEVVLASAIGNHVIENPPKQSLTIRRQPRLAQVGRIPKVVSTRQQPQPGVQAPEQEPRGITLPYAASANTTREQLPRLTTTKPPTTRFEDTSTDTARPEAIGAFYSRDAQTPHADPEFLRFSEVRNSDFTTSSESTGIISIAGPPGSRVQSISRRQMEYLTHEEDVWNEYNDFMDDIMSPSQQTRSRFRMNKTEEKNPSKSGDQSTLTRERVRARGLAIIPPALPVAGPKRQAFEAPALTISGVPSLSEVASTEEIRLRRSRIAAALHNSYTSFDPSSPFSMRDFLDEYGRPGSGKFSEQQSESSAHAFTPPYAFVQPARANSRPRQYENAAQLEEMERTTNPTKHSDHAYASLMVSRWLSFGRVLFSPAHQEIETNPEKHVLVIDGLGSEDWSIYCAVTYQAQRAYVHDLKERRQGRSKVKVPQSAESAPANHRRSEVSSFNDKFPFPPGFFCAIVVRFPPAMPDSKLKNIVSECRRVLAVGGYLELMVLDLDIVNMGPQTRKAIKGLKIKMSSVDRSVSLKPIIDNVSTVLGSNGFSNLSRCVVGVPVVGKPAGSLDSSSESRSSTSSTGGHQRRSSAGPRPYGNLGGQANFSLNDLVADYSENADAKIGRMVSRTARSWWQHCFEAGIIANGSSSQSVFANKEVLKECKGRAANFKLLIAYTQKPIPVEQRRRTMSEPAVPTLATAGAGRLQR